MILPDTTPHPATELGLDARCGTIYVGEDFLATTNSTALETYSDFWKIPPHYRRSAGAYTIYDLNDPRVLKAMLTLEFNHD